MITVHHLENSRSQRILWLLEELDVPYQIEHYKRDAATMLAPDSLRAVHPLGKSPVLTDDATTIAESGASSDYMVASYGEGRLIPPEGTPARLRYTFWLHYAEGLRYAAALDETCIRRSSRPLACASSPACASNIRPGAKRVHRPAAEDSHAVLGERVAKNCVVCRRDVHSR